MMTRRRAALAGAVVMGAVALTGCDIEKPTPLVTLVSGSDSSNAEAVCYTRDNKKPVDIASPECLGDAGGPKATISVEVGDRFAIGTETKMADNGWYIAIEGQRPNTEPYTTTYVNEYRANATLFQATNPLTGETVETDSITLQVVEQTSDKPDAAAKGVWILEIKKKK